MKSHIFQTFITIVLLICVACAGVALTLLPHQANWIHQLVDSLQKHPQKFAKVGQWVLLGGAALFLLLLWIHRRSYYYCEVEKPLKVSVSPQIIKQGIQHILQNLQPKKNIPFKVNIYGQSIELVTDLSQISFEEHEALLDDLEPKLQELFEKNYGEPKKISLAVAALKG